jgi:hypothetical protein
VDEVRATKEDTMRRITTIAIGAITAAATVSGVGLAAASASPARSYTEHFQAIATSPNSYAVIAYGRFAGHGVDHPGNKVDTIRFANGSFQVAHSPGKGPQSFDPKTCVVLVNQHGTYTDGHGTGAYRGITGSGKYQITLVIIGAKSGGKCSNSKPPVAYQLVIRGSGLVTLP